MNILICDDHRLFGDALSTVLTARSWSVVGVANDPAHAVEVVSRAHVDTCLMDLYFRDGTTGLQGITSIHETSPDTRVIVLTASTDPELILLAVQSGADAILFKDDDIDHIVEVVERTHAERDERARQTTAGASSRSKVATPAASAAPTRFHEDAGQFLTARERSVLQALVDGMSGRQLAEHIGVAYSTARSHVQNILVKLGVHSQLEAVSFAIEHNLCEPHRSTPAEFPPFP